jgi:hypothetical protein
MSYATLCSTTLYYSVLICTVPYYTVLFYTDLHCTVLYYTVLFYTHPPLLYRTTLQGRRAALEAKNAAPRAMVAKEVTVRRTMKIGRPGYKVRLTNCNVLLVFDLFPHSTSMHLSSFYVNTYD